MFKVTYRMTTRKDCLYAYALHAEAECDGDDAGAESVEDVLHDPRVFVFRRSTPAMDPFGRNDRVVDDEFFNVATPVDMYEIPPDEPDPCRGMPYYRSSSLDLWFRNASDLERARKDLDDTLRDLAVQLGRMSDPSSFESVETASY